MSLSPGARLGSYEIVAAIGAGGMGVVYRAHDSKLKRDVALKVIADALAHDNTLIARFQREAELLATLTHQHIAAVYGLEDIDGGRALVMELVDGETLADRLTRGPLPIDDVLSIARQLADALEYAHEHGILHRDLKPANIKIGGDGAVKILDFGLAKAINAPGATSSIDSPTITSPAFTQAGIIIGTAAYMAPEQARGRAVDRRADIWAFGCVLYEMLTGLRTFDGETVTDTLAAVLTKEISLTRLSAGTPPQIEQLLHRALTRDPRLRLQSMGEARIIIDQAIANPTVPKAMAAPRPRSSFLPWGIAAAALLAAAVMGLSSFKTVAETKPDLVTFEVAYPPGIVLRPASRPMLSPDERHIALDSRNGLMWIHDLPTGKWTSLKAEGIRGTPMWSPDGRSLAYLTTAGSLRALDLASGATRLIVQLANTGDGGGGSWCRSGVILVNRNRSGGLQSVPANGGAATTLIEADKTKGELGLIRPQCLAGDTFSAIARVTDGYRTLRGNMRSPGERSEADLPGPWILLDDQRGGFIPNEGLLVYQALDGRHQPVGDPEVIARNIGIGMGTTLATGGNRAIAYRSTEAESDRQFVWFDHHGVRGATLDVPAGVRDPQLSPDGKMLAFEAFQGDGSLRTISILRFADGQRQQVAGNGVDNADPIWSADGRTLLFGRTTDTSRSFFIRDLAGTTEQPVTGLPAGTNQWPVDRSPDGTKVVFSDNNLACVVAGLDGNEPRTPVRFEGALQCQFSPNGKYIAMVDFGGDGAVIVEPFPPTGARWRISADAGSEPRWHPNGKELYFLDVDQTLMSTEITLAPEFKAAAPHPLLHAAIPAPMRTGVAHNYAVAPDGSFLINTVKPGTPPQALHVILNWRPQGQSAAAPR